MNQTIVVGDIHGRTEIVEEVLKWDVPTVFVGDYVDSFTRSIKDQIWCLLEVMTAIETRDDVVGLLGNHELSYIEPGQQCSGFKAATSAHLLHMESRMRRVLKEYHWVGDYLITHAGISNHTVPVEYRDRGVEGIKEFLEDPSFHHTKYTVGRARGGFSKFPGPFWCDWWDEFEPIDGVPQIVGHSSKRPQRYEGVTGVVKKGNSYNVDCLNTRNEILSLNGDGSVSFIELDI